MKCTVFFIEIEGLHANSTILPVSHVDKKASTAPLHANPCTFSHFACTPPCLFTIHTRDFLQFTSFCMYASFWSHLLCTRAGLPQGISRASKNSSATPIHAVSGKTSHFACTNPRNYIFQTVGFPKCNIFYKNHLHFVYIMYHNITILLVKNSKILA